MILTQEDLMAIEGLFSKRFDSLEQRMEKLEQRIEKLEQRVEKLEIRMDHVESDISSLKIAQLNTNKKLDEISEKVNYTYRLAIENWGTLTETRIELGLQNHA